MTIILYSDKKYRTITLLADYQFRSHIMPTLQSGSIHYELLAVRGDNSKGITVGDNSRGITVGNNNRE